jgi:hypothetical protein
VAFHVEVSRSFRRAQAFNLSEAELREQVLGPWSEGAPFQLGEREWLPAKSDLRILEGPELDTQELAFGQGWSNAARKARDVTGELVACAPAAIAVLAETSEGRAAVAPLVEALGLSVADSIAGARAGVVVLDAEPSAERAFELGVAVGALGGRVVVVELEGATAPPYLGEAIPLDASQLEERLRRVVQSG